MQGYSPKLPLMTDTTDGSYMLNKTIVETIKQNFKMLILTNPGERVMMPDFGVGIRRFLFDQDTEILRSNIITKLNEQVKRYMNFLIIDEVNISPAGVSEENMMSIQIKYSIANLNVTDILNLQV